MFAFDGQHSRGDDPRRRRPNVANLPGHPATTGRTFVVRFGEGMEPNCHQIPIDMNMELTWRHQTIFYGYPLPKSGRSLWQTTIDGDVWTLRQTPKDFTGCNSIVVERYSHGIRTRIGVAPNHKAAAEMVVRCVQTGNG